jgi:two-component system chemotaxis sensor kinase CheA
MSAGGDCVTDEQDLIREFLIESYENLARLDEEIVELERRPQDQALLDRVFRTVHTLKGTCGCLGYRRLEALAHLGENLLSQIRSGKRELTHPVVLLLLEMAEAIQSILGAIESTGAEGRESERGLRARLEAALEGEPGTVPAPLPGAAAPGDAPEAGGRRPAVCLPESRPAADPNPDGLAGEAGRDADSRLAWEAQEGRAVRSAAAGGAVRVEAGLLDELGTLVEELAAARNRFLEFAGRGEDAAFRAAWQALDGVTERLRESVKKTRVQPIEVVWNALPRVVRELAAASGKRISLEMEGGGIEVDRAILEAIKDPLLHIVRNCCGHGIENPDIRRRAGKPVTGRICVHARHEGGGLTMEITDDGAGVDLENVRACAVPGGHLTQEQADLLSGPELIGLLFVPGFSTAGEVTSISGRGVGMDVVKTNIERIGGAVEVMSRKGAGTTVRIRIPAAGGFPGLGGAAAGEPYVLPRAGLDGDELCGLTRHPPG